MDAVYRMQVVGDKCYFFMSPSVCSLLVMMKAIGSLLSVGFMLAVLTAGVSLAMCSFDEATTGVHTVLGHRPAHDGSRSRVRCWRWL